MCHPCPRMSFCSYTCSKKSRYCSFWACVLLHTCFCSGLSKPIEASPLSHKNNDVTSRSLGPTSLPLGPWAGDPSSGVNMINAYQPPKKEKYRGHIDIVDALMKGEAFSSLLSEEEDAQRKNDLDDDYFLFPPNLGHAVPQLVPMREKLQQKGISFSVVNRGQLLGNFHGGREKGDEYVDRLGFDFNFDLGRLFGFRNWAVYAAINKRGRPATYDKTGEYNIQLMQNLRQSGPDGFRLSSLYAERRFLHDKLNIVFGRVLFSHLYGRSAMLCTFMTSCSAPAGMKTNKQNPKGGWGAKLTLRPTRDTALSVGLFQDFPKKEDASGWEWTREVHGNSLSVPIQFEWTPYLTQDRLAGIYKIGFVHSTAQASDIAGNINKSLKKSWKKMGYRGLPHDKKFNDYTEHTNEMWFQMEQMVYRFGGKTLMDGGYFLGGFIHNTPHTSLLDNQAYAGFSLNGLIKDRPKDRFGFLYSWYHISPRRTLGERILFKDGVSDNLATDLVLGSAYGKEPGTSLNRVNGVQHTSQVIETYYSIDTAPGVIMQPEFLYEIHPNQTHRNPDSAMLGMKAIVNL